MKASRFTLWRSYAVFCPVLPTMLYSSYRKRAKRGSYFKNYYTILWVYTQYRFFIFPPIIFKNPWAVKAMISYEPLWQTMKEKKVTQYRLLQSGIDNKTLDTLKKNNNITLLTLEKLCRILSCSPNDVVQFLPEKDQAGPSL